MNLYKEIEIDNYELIRKEIYDYIINKTSILDTDRFWTLSNYREMLVDCPMLSQYIEKFVKLDVIYIGLVKVDNATQEVIHIDTDNTCKLLLPILNSDSAETRFYNTPKQECKNTPLYDYGFDIFTSTRTKDEMIGKIVVKQPTILNAAIAHSVHILSNKKLPRITCSIGVNHTDDRKNFVDS